MVAGYVILDGYDLGAGIIHLVAARTHGQREQILKTIAPLWDGNEVWLIALGGTLFFAFPRLYASSFSGFYLPLMMVLWLLMARGLSIEFRHQVNDPVWKNIWDAAFSLASGILAFVFGVALGNVLRGTTLDASGRFFLGLWTDFSVNPPVGVLDWYTLTIGLLAFTTLTVHGSLWVEYRTEGDVMERAGVMAWFGLAGMVALIAAATIFTFRVQPQLIANLIRYPWGYLFPAIATAGFLGIVAFKMLGDALKAFVSSSACIFGMISSAAFGIFPYVLPSDTNPDRGLTIYNTATATHTLVLALIWWIPGMTLAIGYSLFTHRKFSEKVPVQPET